jgi:hypothetical protein
MRSQIPTEPETKNDYPGHGQQQITALPFDLTFLNWEGRGKLAFVECKYMQLYSSPNPSISLGQTKVFFMDVSDVVDGLLCLKFLSKENSEKECNPESTQRSQEQDKISKYIYRFLCIGCDINCSTCFNVRELLHFTTELSVNEVIPQLPNTKSLTFYVINPDGYKKHLEVPFCCVKQ